MPTPGSPLVPFRCDECGALLMVDVKAYADELGRVQAEPPDAGRYVGKVLLPGAVSTVIAMFLVGVSLHNDVLQVGSGAVVVATWTYFTTRAYASQARKATAYRRLHAGDPKAESIRRR